MRSQVGAGAGDGIFHYVFFFFTYNHCEIWYVMEHNAVDFCQHTETESVREERKNIEDLRCNIIENLQEITALFATLVLNTYRLLQEKKVPIKDLIIALAFLGGNGKIAANSGDLSQSSDLAEFFTNLHKYSSWFNYFVIEFLATTFGGDQGKALITAYEEQLRNKIMHHFVHQCPEFALTRELPNHYQELTVKIERDYMFYTINDLSLLRNTMAKLMKLKPSTFILKSVEEGCVLLTWVVPISSSKSVISLIKKHAAELEAYSVISVKTGDKEVLITKVGNLK